MNEKQSKATEKQSKKDLSALRKIPKTSRQKGAEKQSKRYHGQSKHTVQQPKRYQARCVRRQTPRSGARFCSSCARPSPSAAPRPEKTEGENAKSAQTDPGPIPQLGPTDWRSTPPGSPRRSPRSLCTASASPPRRSTKTTDDHFHNVHTVAEDSDCPDRRLSCSTSTLSSFIKFVREGHGDAEQTC